MPDVESNSKVIALEGLPGAGKTTILDKLSTKYPTVSEIVLNNEQSQNEEIFYFRNDIEKIRLSRLNSGVTIIDRSYPSTLAYNYSMLMLDKQMDYFNLLELFFENKARRINQIDQYIFIDIRYDLSLLRKNRVPNLKDLWTVPEYLKVIHDYYQIYFDFIEPDVPMTRVDGNRGIDTVYNEILKILKSYE